MRKTAGGARPGSPFQEFFRTEAATGVLLFAAACAALLVANSPWAGILGAVILRQGRGPVSE